MTLLALDSNVLVYAELDRQTEKGRLSQRLIEATLIRGVLAAQVLGELLAVVRRRRPAALPQAMSQVEDYATAFIVAPTTERVVLRGGELSRRFDLQLWDAIICAASASAGGHPSSVRRHAGRYAHRRPDDPQPIRTRE